MVMKEDEKKEGEYEIKDFSFALAKMFEVTRALDLGKFLMENVRTNDIEVSSYGSAFRNFFIKFKVKVKR